MSSQLGVGVVGVGLLGRQHATYLATQIPAARLVAIADPRTEIAAEVAAALNVPKTYATAEELAADPDVEALVIVSSDDAHIDGILAAATNRKDVFCEKPITTTLADADRAIAACEDAGVRLQIGFMRQYDAAYIAAKRAIESGAIGTPVYYKSAHRGKESFPDSRPASAGCNPAGFLSSNIHDYNDARWLLADEAVEVTATGTRIVTAEAPNGVDAGVTIIKYSRGTLADIEYISTSQYGYDVRAEIVGDKGTVFIGSPQGTGCVVATAAGLQQPAMDHWLSRFAEAYLVELTDWVKRMLAGDPPYITGRDGRAALEIAIAAQRAYASGSTIRLPLV
jgi:scyllo-inositol 2-dehydrogenase (NAD+)